jgi:hypothetical protein
MFMIFHIKTHITPMLVLLFTSSFIMAETTNNGNTHELQFIGYAYSLDETTLLYSEHHTIVSTEDKKRVSSHVQYTSPQGELISKKSLIYNGNGYFPDYDFIDLRANTQISVNKIIDKVIINQTNNLNQEGDNIQTLTSLTKGTMVADAGFDVFMMSHWSTLILGKAHSIEFLAPTKGMFITFKIKRTFINQSVVRFSLAPDNFFISLLVDPIFLEYDLVSGQILSYKGLTNIEKFVNGSGTGNHYIAHIKYKYDLPYKKP